MLVDPTQREHLVADGMVVVAMNKHREICMVEMSGCVLLVLEQVNSLSLIIISGGGGGNLRPRRPLREYLGEYTSRGKPKI